VYAQRASLIAFFVVTVWSRATLAGEPELKLGEFGKQSDARSSAVVYGFARRWRFCPDRSEPRGLALVVKTYDPSGKPFRGAELGPQEGTQPRREVSGAFRVEVPPWTLSRRDLLPLALEKVVTLAARLAPPQAVAVSPRIQALELRSSMENGTASTLFWKRSGRQARR